MMQTCLTFVLAYLITRVGYRGLNFNPIDQFSLWPGLALDIGIWLVVYSISDWIIRMLMRRASR